MVVVEKFLIKNTTREEREQIVMRSLSCGGGGCDECSGCGIYGAGSALDMYQPYIDGEKELAEITAQFSARYTIRGR